MQVVKETLSPCQVSLQISVEPEKVATAVDKAYREFSKQVTIPGFRKGHAPLNFVKPRIPEEHLRERVAELLVEPAYVEAVKQESVEPFAPPKLDLVEIETKAPDQKFSFKATIPLPPQVALGNYKGLAVERQKYAITDESVDQRIEQIRERAAEYPLVEDRAAALGDVLVTDLVITPEGSSEPAPSRPTVIHLGDAGNVPGLDAELVGLSKGEDKAFRLTYPDDFPEAEAAGKTAGFFVTVNEIHEKKLPALDDEFAKKFGKTETLEEFKAAIRADLDGSMNDMANQLVETKLIDQAVANSTIDFPDVILENEVEAEVRELLEDLKKREIELPDYLERSGKTEESLLEEFKAQAEVRIRRGLALGEIARSENISVAPVDVDKEIAERAARQRTTPEAMRAYLEAQNQVDVIARTVLTKKVLGFLTDSAIITERELNPDEEPDAGSAETPETSKPAPKKPRATKKKADEKPTE